jgi:hypothetical protein
MPMALKAIQKHGFQKCFQQWQHRWAKCMAAQGEYLQAYSFLRWICLQKLIPVTSWPHLLSLFFKYILYKGSKT